ncbi:chemotaxis protein CheW [Pseudomonadota bacterium]
MAQGLDMVGIDINSDDNQYLTFILADEEYGVDILRVQEIKGWDIVTAIPNTPDYIKGVINLRGTIVPIVDLRERFNLPPTEYSVTTVVIVLRVDSDTGSRIMGIVVDAVSEVYNLPEDELKSAPDFGQAISTDFVRGLATVEEKMVIVLDIDHLLNSSVLRAVDDV